MKACPFCAEDIQDAAIVCKHCGRDLVHSAATVVAPAAPAAKKPTSRGVKIFAWTLASVALLMLIGAFSGGSRTPQSAEMSDAQRGELLKGAITGVGESCDAVTRVFYQGGDAKNSTFWNVACANGKSYSVRQEQTGAVTILNCDVLKDVSHLSCFVPLTNQK